MRDIFAKDENLLCGGLLGKGSFGSVYKANYKRKKMALKKFSGEIEIPDSVSLKLIEMCKDFDKFDEKLITPKYVFDDKKVEKYLIDLVKGENFTRLYDLSVVEKIKILRKAKECVCSMNNKGIIHGDLYLGNFMYDNKNEDVFIIDFDSCGYGDYELEVDLINELSQAFIRYNGINSGVDRFMFNLITVAFLNNKFMCNARIDILRGDYGILDFDECRKMCDLFAKFYRCDDFLIDVIDEKKVRERLDMK